jgi:hypothetical protein
MLSYAEHGRRRADIQVQPSCAVLCIANWTEKDENFQALAFASRSSAKSGAFKWTMGWAELQGGRATINSTAEI